MRPERIRCEVPFCERTTKGDPSAEVWICADHWKLGGRNARKAERAARKRGEIERANRLWWHVRHQIIEAAAGIG